MRTKLVDISNLKLAKYNPRQISDHDITSLVNSIREFGIVEPIVVNKDNTVIGGHQRLVACKQLSITKVPVVYVDLSKKKEKILNLALNRIHGDWDMEKLSVVLEELKLGNGDEIGLTGFELGEIDEIIDSQIPEDEGEDNFDAESEASKIKKPISKRGEIYQLDRHKLMCGDATVKEDVEKLMDGKKADMVFTDPPYGLSYSGKGPGSAHSNRRLWSIFENDNLIGESWLNFAKAFCNNLPLFQGDAYICIDWRNYPLLLEAFPQGWKVWNCIVWKKNFIGLGYKYRYTHEFIVYASMGEAKLLQKDQSDIWELNRDVTSEYEHPTQKPLMLPFKAIKNSSRLDDLIIDFFGGSGTTLIACEKTGRICYMMEIDPVYCDVIPKRYKEYVAQKDTKCAIRT